MAKITILILFMTNHHSCPTFTNTSLLIKMHLLSDDFSHSISASKGGRVFKQFLYLEVSSVWKCHGKEDMRLNHANFLLHCRYSSFREFSRKHNSESVIKTFLVCISKHLFCAEKVVASFHSIKQQTEASSKQGKML